MNDVLMDRVDKIWRKLRKLSHVDQLDVLAELTWRCRTELKIMEEGDDGEECLCHDCRHERGETVDEHSSPTEKGEFVEITSASPAKVKDKLFEAVWASLARKGKLGDMAGRKFDEVFRMWQKSGRPLEVKRFILANI